MIGPGERDEPREDIGQSRRRVGAQPLHIALARRMTEQRLLRSEQKFEDLITGMDTPVMVLDHQGTIALLNRRFTDSYGYDLVDITSWDTWLEKAFPDTEYRNNVALLLNKDKEGKPELLREVFSLTCRDNSIKPVSIKQVNLSDGMKALLLMPDEMRNIC